MFAILGRTQSMWRNTKGRERMKKSKPEILYISDTFKETNEFLGDLAHDLNEMGVPILDFCRQRLVLKTESCILYCLSMMSRCFLKHGYSNVKFFVNSCSSFYKEEFEELVLFRLKPDVKEIKDRRELIKLLTGIKFDETDLQSALQYYKMWVDYDNQNEMTDGLSNYRWVAYECIKECLERRKANGK